jgi:hypothetical protein
MIAGFFHSATSPKYSSNLKKVVSKLVNQKKPKNLLTSFGVTY